MLEIVVQHLKRSNFLILKCYNFIIEKSQELGCNTSSLIICLEYKDGRNIVRISIVQSSNMEIFFSKFTVKMFRH